MTQDIDYSKMSNAELEAIVSSGEGGGKPAAEQTDKKIKGTAAIHPALGALGGGYAGYKMGRPIVDWYAAKTASDIGDIATHMKAGVPSTAIPTQQMTGGERWTKSLTGADIPGAQMAKEDLDLAKGMQRTVGRGGELAGGAITKGGVMVGPGALPEVAKLAAQETAPAAKQGILSRIAQAAVPKGAVGKLANIGIPTLSMAGAGAEAVDAWNRAQRGDYGRAAISGLGALGSAASMIPHPLTRIGGTGVALAAPAINAAIDYVMPPEQAPMAGSVMQGYADGGTVSNDTLMQMLRANRAARATNMQSQPGRYMSGDTPTVQFVPQSYMKDAETNAMFQPSINTVSMQRRPGGMNMRDMSSLAHEFQHHKDTLAPQNPLNAYPGDEDRLRAIQDKINRHMGQVLDTNRPPVDMQARNALTQQAGINEVMPQLAGYEAALPAGQSVVRSPLGQAMTPQEKAMVLRRMNPLPKNIDAWAYAAGGLASLK